MTYVEEEYSIFKERINTLPSDVELHYLESIGELKQIVDNKN